MKPAAPVTTVLGIALENSSDEREPHDLEIEGDGPVFDVVQVVFDSLFERRITPPSVHLGPAGNSGFHLVAKHVLRNAVLELLDEKRPFGTRSDDRHVAAEHVPELRQFIEV